MVLRSALGAGLIAVLAACSSGSDAIDEAKSSSTTASIPTTSTPVSSTTTPLDESGTTTTTVAPALDRDGRPRALVTTTDVVVPVLAALTDGWVVRTPCQEVTVVEAGRAVDAVHVVLDPGHGGSEPGAVIDSVTEASLNLRVAEIAEAKLKRLGFEVLLTRYANVRMPIVSRVEIADSLAAPILISIHHQGGGELPIAGEPGTEVFYQQDSLESRRFAGLLVEESRVELGRFDIDGWFAGPDAGATFRPDASTGEDFYGMVRRPVGPAVLAEMSFMGNPAELELLGRRDFLEAEAQAIADAVVRWFSTDDAGSGFVQPSFSLSSSGGGGGLGACEDPDLGPARPVPADFELAGVGAGTESD